VAVAEDCVPVGLAVAASLLDAERVCDWVGVAAFTGGSDKVSDVPKEKKEKRAKRKRRRTAVNKAALENVTQFELAGTLAVYGIFKIGPSLSGGC
jgi:hypothetical protein